MMEAWACETGYLRYALPEAEVVSIADNSSSMSSLEAEFNLGHQDENSAGEALEEIVEQGNNNFQNEIDIKN